MSRNKKKKKKKNDFQLPTKTWEQRQPRIQLICGWCGERIRLGEESDNLYEPDDAYKDRVPKAMARVHKEHVRLEDHPLYDQMPHIVFTGLPDGLEGVYEGF